MLFWICVWCCKMTSHICVLRESGECYMPGIRRHVYMLAEAYAMKGTR
jgi:hypothetical protein